MEVNNFDESGGFLHEEEYSQEFLEPREYPKEENWDEITNIPSFESMLTIPNNFLLQMVRNPFEAAMLLRVAAIGAEMDVILEFIMEQLRDRKKIQEYIRISVKSNPNGLDTTLFILQNQASQVTQKSLCKLLKQFDDCISSLSCILVPLQQISDANAIAIEEFEEFGGGEIALKKQELAQVEDLLIQRCQQIVQQHELPTNHIGYPVLDTGYTYVSHDTSSKISENSQVLFQMSSSSECSTHSLSISASNESNVQQQQDKASRCPLGLLSSSEGESSSGSAYSKKEK